MFAIFKSEIDSGFGGEEAFEVVGIVAQMFEVDHGVCFGVFAGSINDEVGEFVNDCVIWDVVAQIKGVA